MALERLAYTQPLLTDCACLKRHVAASRKVVAVALKVLGESLPRAAASADLGGSSKYSSENLED